MQNDPINETFREYGEVFKLVHEALQNALDAFEECQEYPITKDLVCAALYNVHGILKRDYLPVWNITIPDVKSIVQSINEGN